MEWLYPQTALSRIWQRPREDEDRSALIGLHPDPIFAHAPDKVWLVEVATRPYQPPPKYGRPVYPAGRPASVILMCLERLDETSNKFRRIGMAEAMDIPEWRQRANKEVIQLF